MTDTAQPVSVQVALARVMGALPAIGKDDSSPELGYRFRGIERLTAAIQPLLAEHGVIIVPQVRSMEVVVSQASRHPAMQDVRLGVDWCIVGPDGSSLTATTYGIGRDHTDKGANKAQTQAYKYLLLHLLCISDAKDDADGRDPEAEAPAPPPQATGPDPVQVAFARVKALKGTPGAVALKEWAGTRKLTESAMARDAGWLADVVAKLDAIDAAAAQDADAEAAPDAQDEPEAPAGDSEADTGEVVAPAATEPGGEMDTHQGEADVGIVPDEVEPTPPTPVCGYEATTGEERDAYTAETGLYVGGPCYLPEGHDGGHRFEEPF